MSCDKEVIWRINTFCSSNRNDCCDCCVRRLAMFVGDENQCSWWWVERWMDGGVNAIRILGALNSTYGTFSWRHASRTWRIVRTNQLSPYFVVDMGDSVLGLSPCWLNSKGLGMGGGGESVKQIVGERIYSMSHTQWAQLWEATVAAAGLAIYFMDRIRPTKN